MRGPGTAGSAPSPRLGARLWLTSTSCVCEASSRRVTRRQGRLSRRIWRRGCRSAIRADPRHHARGAGGPLRARRADRVARALPGRVLPRRTQRLRRRVATDALVDVDTVRDSVPHALVRDHVEVAIGDTDVQIFHGTALVSSHRRIFEPHTRVVDPAHWAGLWRTSVSARQEPPPTTRWLRGRVVPHPSPPFYELSSRRRNGHVAP